MGLSDYSSHPGQDVNKSRPRHFLPAIGQHAICIESRSPDPLNKSHLGISHIWACLITAVTLAKTLSYSGNVSIVLTWYLISTKEMEGENYSPIHLQHSRRKRKIGQVEV